MHDSSSGKKRERLRGVTALPPSHGERRYRARISAGQGRQVNLGSYPTRWLAAFAYNIAAEALHGQGRARNEIPGSEQPSSEQVRVISERVLRRLGLEQSVASGDEQPPTVEQLLTLLEITVVNFWRDQVDVNAADHNRELDRAARRLMEAAHVLFWCRSAGHPSPLEALARVLAKRLDQTFRRSDVTRAVLDDEGDDERRVARWLVYPDSLPGGGGFRMTVEDLYADTLGANGSPSANPEWSVVLGIVPPLTSEQVRIAYRALSKRIHPDAGGSEAEFVRLQAAYEAAQHYCTVRGI